MVIGEGLCESVLDQLSSFVSAFYGLRVTVVRADGLEKAIAAGTVRTVAKSATRQRQLFAGDAITFALASVAAVRELSRCSVATLALTMEDLTKNETWNFVYGLASLAEGTAVVSLARFSPEFNDEPISAPEERDAVILQRAAKVVAHELGHIFGLRHCISFRCLMNGVNHVGELNLQLPLECPCCTKKLQSSFGWNLLERYRQLALALKEVGFQASEKYVSEVVLPLVEHAHADHPAIARCAPRLGTFFRKL